MALTNDEIELVTCKLRILWLRDLLTLYIRQDNVLLPFELPT